MIKNFKLFEQNYEDPFGEEMLHKEFDLDESCKIVKKYVIDHPNEINYRIENILDSYGIYCSDDQYNEVVEIFYGGLNKYNKIYDDIIYEKIKKNSVVICNYQNSTSGYQSSEPVEVELIYNEDCWRAKLKNKYSVMPWNIKGVIKY